MQWTGTRVVIVASLFAIFLSVGCQPPGAVAPAQVFRFQRQDGISATVTRNVAIDARPQNVGGKTRELVVSADPLPAEQPAPPPDAKGIKKLIRVVIEPRARFKDTNETVYTFDPPLTITIDFTAEDANAVPRDSNGKPQLSILTYFKDEKGFHWERLPTTVTCGKTCDEGTLKAEIKTLHPNDPVCEGFP